MNDLASFHAHEQMLGKPNTRKFLKHDLPH
jgi:hypothetical protein